MLEERHSWAVPIKNPSKDGLGKGTPMLKLISSNNREEI